jgi:hypothetical protein
MLSSVCEDNGEKGIDTSGLRPSAVGHVGILITRPKLAVTRPGHDKMRGIGEA